MTDALTRDSRGVRTEKTGSSQVDDFSSWHRANCARASYLTDIDGLAFRHRHGSLLPVALIEAKAWHVTQDCYVLSAATEAHYKVARLAGIRYLYVWYNSDCTQFRLWDVTAEPNFEPGGFKKLWSIHDSAGMTAIIDGL